MRASHSCLFSFLGILLSGAAACRDALAPDQAEGTLLAAGSLALQWSPDGREIFYYDSGYTPAAPRRIPGRILAVDVTSRETRVVVPSGAYGAAGGERPGAVPPHATIAGLAYVRMNLDGFAVHLVRAAADEPLAPSGGWVTVTPDRHRLLHNFPQPDPFNDSIGMIDLTTGDRTVFGTGAYGPVPGAAVAPDGNAMLVERLDAEAGFGILSFLDSTITAVPDSAFPGAPSFTPTPLGWNADGVWFLLPGGPPRLVRYDVVTSAVQRFPITDERVGSLVLGGGTVLPAGGTVVWSQNCHSTDPLTGLCDLAAYALWHMNPLTGAHDLLVSLTTTPAFDFPRSVFAAASPDGAALAYLLGNELRLLPLH